MIAKRSKNQCDGIFEQGSLSNGGLVNSTTRIRSVNFIPLINKGVSIISAKGVNSVIFVFYDEEKNWLAQTGWSNLPYLRTVFATNYAYMKLVFKIDDTTPITPQDISDVMFELGNVATDYKPYIRPITDLKLRSKNLLEGIELGEISSTTGELSNHSSVVRSKNFIKIKEGETCIINSPDTELSSGVNIREYDEDKKYLGYSTFNTTTKTYTAKINVNFIKFRTPIANMPIDSRVQIEKGTVATEYKPYSRDIKVVLGANKNKLIKQGLSTPKTDTDFWYYNQTHSNFTPLEKGWGRYEYDNTNETSIVYINSFIKLAGANLKPNTQYTIFTEFRNVSEDNKLDFYPISISTNSSAFTNTSNISISSIKDGNIVKVLNTTVSDFIERTISLRTYARATAGSKGSFEARIMILEGDHTKEDLVYEAHRPEKQIFPKVE